jgi:phosphoglycolate phosphatase
MTFFPPRPCRLFLFDLDGTLVDSKADIACSLNFVLERMGLQPLPESRVAEFVGDGVQKLLERTFREVNQREPESSMIREGVVLFKQEYGKHLLDRTQLYPHVQEALNRLSWAAMAVVSNKPERFCRSILEGLGVAARFQAILGGDSTPSQKPAPAPLLKAMDLCGAAPSETVMVGDSPVDIAAGKAAGVLTCGVLGGFRPKEHLLAADCDLIVDNLLELPEFFFPFPE